MKRWMIYSAAAVLILLVVRNGTSVVDLGRLEPVEVIRVAKQNQTVTVETDTGQLGRGTDLSTAMADLKSTANREVFLDTAAFLLVTPEAENCLPQLKEILRPGCNICIEDGTADLTMAASYLKIHDPGLTLKDYNQESVLPILRTEEGRMYLAQP